MSRDDREKVVENTESPAGGTFFSVGIVGAVILITYIVLYGLYMARIAG